MEIEIFAKKSALLSLVTVAMPVKLSILAQHIRRIMGLIHHLVFKVILENTMGP